MTQMTARPKARKASKASAPIAATEPRSCRSEVEEATWRMVYEQGFPRHLLALELIRVAAGIVSENEISTRRNVARELRNGASLLELGF